MHIGAVPFTPVLPSYEHQLQARAKARGREYFAYLMEQGTGKTKTTLDEFMELYAANQMDALLVVAPNGVHENWILREIPTHCPPDLMTGGVCYSWDSKRMRKGKDNAIIEQLMSKDPGPRIMAVSAESLSSVQAARDLCDKFLRRHRTMMVVDESTLMANHESERSKVLYRLGPLASARRILTGTPGDPEKIYSQFHFLRPGILGHHSYYSFRAQFCITREIPSPSGGRPVRLTVGYRNVDELAKLVEEHSFRVRKKDCLDLPEKIYKKRYVELTDDQVQAYNQMRKFCIAQLQEASTVTAQLAVTQLMRLQQIVTGHVKTDDGIVVPIKSNRVAAMLDEVQQTGESVIVWCKFDFDLRAVTSALRKEYGDESVVEYHGGVPDRLRSAAIDDFQSGKARFFVANRAAARGLTLTAANMVIYYSNDESLEVRQQSEDRPHRIGQKNPVLYVDLVAKGTSDERILKNFREGKDLAASILQDGFEAWI